MAVFARARHEAREVERGRIERGVALDRLEPLRLPERVRALDDRRRSGGGVRSDRVARRGGERRRGEQRCR
jgi:hypothetical protein